MGYKPLRLEVLVPSVICDPSASADVLWRFLQSHLHL